MAQETSARGSKVVSLRDAARLIPDGALITFGGVLLNRPPAAFVRELARGRRDLRLVKPSPAYDLDLLAAGRAHVFAGAGCRPATGPRIFPPQVGRCRAGGARTRARLDAWLAAASKSSCSLIDQDD